MLYEKISARDKKAGNIVGIGEKLMGLIVGVEKEEDNAPNLQLVDNFGYPQTHLSIKL